MRPLVLPSVMLLALVATPTLAADDLRQSANELF